jgi:23S rRNA (uridine2552-2'-O)-methyltransferase
LKKHRSNPSWIRSHLNDPYVREAQLRGFRSRAAFKLTEIDDRDHLFAPGQVVVDLGAAPGSWSQVIAERVGSKGCVLAIDLLPLEPMPGVQVIQGDFREQAVLQQLTLALQGRPVDVVVSDMAPNISGIAASDQARHAHLCELALEFALDHLRPEGAFLVKAFQGSGFQEFHASLKQAFTQVSSRKPLASRERSPEMYLLARGLRRT